MRPKNRRDGRPGQGGRVRILGGERTAIDKAWVVSKLVENYERAIGAKQAVEQNVNPIGPAAVPNLSAANKALELIGRTLGMFVDRKEAIKPNDLSHLTDEELDRRIVEKSQALGFVRLEKPETPH
jgi:hypothetical protein